MNIKRFFTFNKNKITENNIIDNTDNNTNNTDDNNVNNINTDDNTNIDNNKIKKIEIEPDFEEIDFFSNKDQITLSETLLLYLNEMSNKNYNKIVKDDIISLIDKNQKKLPDDAYNYLINGKIFKVIKTNSKNKIDIGFFKRYTKDNKKIKRVYYFSNRRFINISNIDNVSKLLLLLQNINKDKLQKYPIDFIDVDNKGNFSGVSRRNLSIDEDGFKSNKRQTLKLNKMLHRIVTTDFYNSMIKQKDLEIFINKWNTLFDESYTIEILEGDDILMAYNKKYLSSGWHNSSCANFNESKNLNIKTFDIYTKNPKNIKCLIVKHKGKIYGRRMLFTGKQTKTMGIYKKDKNYILLNAMYGEGGRGSKVDMLIKKWAKTNNADLIEETYKNKTDVFCIEIENTTCFPNFPPFDYMYVNFKTNELSNKSQKGFVSAYGARCPKKYN